MKVFVSNIPIHDVQAATEELNAFLAQHRILNIDHTLVQDGVNSAWTFCVSYEPASVQAPAGKRSKIDYREVLSEADFRLYARLRSLRKELAEKEGVPAYALFTNEQLAEMVRQRTNSMAGLGKLSGVGAGKLEKYGQSFLDCLTAALASEPAANGSVGP